MDNQSAPGYRSAPNHFGTLIAAVCLALSISLAPGIAGKPPELGTPLPVEDKIATGKTIVFQIHYKDSEGDVPIEAGVKLTTPSGAPFICAVPATDLAAIHDGSSITVNYLPTAPGMYRYYYYVRAASGTARFPEDTALSFQVQPSWLPWAIIGGGFLFSFLILSTLIYQVMHRGLGVRQQSAARVSIMVAIVCEIVCILYAEDLLTNLIACIAAAIIALLLIVWALVVR